MTGGDRPTDRPTEQPSAVVTRDGDLFFLSRMGKAAIGFSDSDLIIFNVFSNFFFFFIFLLFLMYGRRCLAFAGVTALAHPKTYCL